MVRQERYRHFPPTHEAMTAVDLYGSMASEIPSPRNEIYLSRPLTGGGIKDWLSQSDLNFPRRMEIVLSVNEEIAKVIAGEIEHSFGDKKLAFPPFLRFGELNAINFWMFFVSGIDIQSAQQFSALVERKEVVNVSVFNDYQAGKDIRQQEYRKLLTEFTNFLEERDCLVNPVSTLVLLPDHQRSLGSFIEREVAKLLRTPVKEAVFDRKHPRFSTAIIQKLLQPLTIHEDTWRHIQGYEFPIPAVEGDGKRLIVLRDFQE